FRPLRLPCYTHVQSALATTKPGRQVDKSLQPGLPQRGPTSTSNRPSAPWRESTSSPRRHMACMATARETVYNLAPPRPPVLRRRQPCRPPHRGPSVPYVAGVSRTTPTCLLFLIDQSPSMSGPFGGSPGKTKADGVADAVNRLLQNLALKCAKSDGIRDYFHVGVIGYGASVQSALGGALAGRHLVPV